jgi:hypothetical protein
MSKLIPNTPFRAAILACLLVTGFLIASFAQKQPAPKLDPRKPYKADASTFKITIVPVGPT